MFHPSGKEKTGDVEWETKEVMFQKPKGTNGSWSIVKGNISDPNMDVVVKTYRRPIGSDGNWEIK